MNSPFFEKSKEITNDFIQNILFVDDQIYGKGDKNHELETEKLIKIFSKAQKLCAFSNPSSEEDFDDIIEVAKKSDISVLDWKINFDDSENDLLEEEKDVDTIDNRGAFTLKLIEHLLEERKNELKLIFIYTAEVDLQKIAEVLLGKLKKYDVGRIANNIIGNQSFRIIVAGKPTLKVRFAHIPELKEWIVEYEDIPETLLIHFTNMTSGLLSNFALLSLTVLRKNSSKIIGLFSKDLDSAYLSHKSLLPNQEDAEDLLIQLFGDTISDLLFYNKSNEIVQALTNEWITENINEENKELLKKDGTQYNPAETFVRTREILIGLINSPDKDIEKRYIDVLNSKTGISKNKLKDYHKYISLNNTLLFLNDDREIKKTEIDQKFSMLTHHKSLFIPNNTIPRLTLGTIIRSSLYKTKYYICIQQKCDSVRMSKEEERRFLFIPLIISDNKFDIITPDGVKLKREKNSFSIRTIKFVCKGNTGDIKAEWNDEGAFIFKQKYDDEHFEWVFDMKDLHSQRIIIDYTSQLSRVGLDESEWLRRWSGN